MTPLTSSKLEYHDAQMTHLGEGFQPATQASPSLGGDRGASREDDSSHLAPVTTLSALGDRSSRESLLHDANAAAAQRTSPAATPGKDRSISNLFSRSPTSDGERKDGRIYNKLRKKKRTSDAANGSAQSSTHSLTDA